VLRIPRNDGAVDSIARDQRLLPELAAHLPVPIPVPLFTAPNPLGPGAVGAYRMVEGEALDEDEWGRRGLLTEANALIIASIVDGLAGFPVDRARALGVTETGDRADLVADLARVRGEVAPLLEPALATRLVERWERFLADDAHFAGPPGFVHGDLSLDHLLVVDGTVAGLIDFGDVALGDPDADLGYLWAEAGRNYVAQVQAARGRTLDERLATKLEFLQLVDEVGDVLWALDFDDEPVRTRALGWVTASLADRR
jgi:aminoglycoside phosphotransferase (APT) family kinase protein